VRWLLPLAYQETRVGAQASGLPHPAWLLAASAEGWQTNQSVFNPADAMALATFRYQAEGNAPRPMIEYPVEARSQVVLQPGFGLGLPGGPGWAEITSPASPMTVAFESIRTANGVAGLAIEDWAAPAWPFEEEGKAPRVIGLPDLGGPALGSAADRIVGPSSAVTGSLVTNIAIQNPLTVTTRVAIDSYGSTCGYLGTVLRSIDPRQTTVLAAADLAGAPFGADSALIRVLEGSAAVLAVTSRTEWLAATAQDVPPDLSTGYLGGGWGDPLPGPGVVTATLSLSQDAFELERPARPVRLTFGVTDASATGRCLALAVSSDSAWLRADRDWVSVPATVTLTVDPLALGGETHVGTVTLDAFQPGVVPDPARVTVTVMGPVVAPRAYLPRVERAAAP
jgi:hypothetical protein